jgi:hypothetical protein
VRGFDNGDESTCNVTDILAELSRKKDLVDLTVDDLNYERWVGYLKEDILFDQETQFLVLDNPTGRTISVKNERHWRAAVRVALRSGKEEVVFSVKEGKFLIFLFPPCYWPSRLGADRIMGTGRSTKRQKRQHDDSTDQEPDYNQIDDGFFNSMG